jgi:hypothetical protein
MRTVADCNGTLPAVRISAQIIPVSKEHTIAQRFKSHLPLGDGHAVQPKELQ